jgi:hypothetical protein
MNFDSRLRDELHEAVDGHDLREEIALQHVKSMQPTEWSDFAVVALEDPTSPHRPHARAQRLVGVLAACALLAGAVALPVALRNRPPAARAAAAPVTTGYRSTATVRIGPAPSHPSPSSGSTPASPTTAPLGVKLTDPVLVALRPEVRDQAIAQSHLRSDDPGIDFQATTDTAGDLLSLIATAPTGSEATTLARNWAAAFVAARIAEATVRIRAAAHNLNSQLTKLHGELQRVDRQLVKLLPATYKNLLHFDSGNNGLGHATPPPPVPEQGSVKALNLAFERIQLLASISQLGDRVARSAGTVPAVYASVVSQTPAALIDPPHRDSNTSTTVIAIGLLLGGLVLAAGAFLLGRRSRRPRVRTAESS